MSWKPDGYNSLSPYLVTRNAQQVMDFLASAVDATPLRRYETEDGSILHGEMRIDDSVLMLGEAGEDWPATPSHLHLYVPDVDAAYSAALEAGAESVQKPVQRDGDPDRRGGVLDPGGNTWWLSTRRSTETESDVP